MQNETIENYEGPWMDTTETSQKGTDNKERLLSSTRHSSSARDGRIPWKRCRCDGEPMPTNGGVLCFFVQ